MRAVIRAEEFKRLIDNTKKFTGGSGLMQWIYLQVKSTAEITATALDGHRVSVEHAHLMECDEAFNCYIKPTIKVKKNDDPVEIELTDGKLFITVGDNITGYKQPEGTYYPVDKVFKDTQDEEIKASIAVNPKLLKDALDSLTYSHAVIMEIRNKKSPIIVRPASQGIKENIKLVLPMNVSKEDY